MMAGLPDCARDNIYVKKTLEARADAAWMLEISQLAIQHHERDPRVQKLLVKYMSHYTYAGLSTGNGHEFIWCTLCGKAAL